MYGIGEETCKHIVLLEPGEQLCGVIREILD